MPKEVDGSSVGTCIYGTVLEVGQAVQRKHRLSNRAEQDMPVTGESGATR